MVRKVSVAQAASAANPKDAQAAVNAAVLADLQALLAAYTALLLKLDADAGVTDVNYHSLTATAAPVLNTLA